MWEYISNTIRKYKMYIVTLASLFLIYVSGCELPGADWQDLDALNDKRKVSDVLREGRESYPTPPPGLDPLELHIWEVEQMERYGIKPKTPKGWQMDQEKGIESTIMENIRRGGREGRRSVYRHKRD